MILIISTNKDKLHFNEFVNPVGKILIQNNVKGFIRNYSCLTKKDIEKANKIIICGTSLQDDKFLNHLNKFEFVKTFQKPILGICAGMQIISLVFGSKLKPKTEIGFYQENFKKEFLGAEGQKQKVYHLHNNYTTLPKDFTKYTTSKIPQAIKHSSKDIYGVLFHPEVRNKKIIENFIKI